MHKPVIAAFVALMGTHTGAMAASCTLPELADTVDLKQVRGSNLVTVPVAINGMPRQFLLDIGTRPTKISQAAVAALSLPEASQRTESIQLPRVEGDLAFGGGAIQATVHQVGSGANQDNFRSRVRLKSFTIGDATAKNRSFIIANDGEIPAPRRMTGC